MKKLLLLHLILLSIWFVSAQVDTWFSDAVNSGVQATINLDQLRINYKLNPLSCENMSEYITNLAKNTQIYNPWIMYAQDKGVSTNWMIAPKVWWTPEANVVSARVNTSIGDNSDVNSQILGVNESDILRSNGKYMFFHNQKTSFVQIIKIPTGSEKPQIINNIKMPEWFETAMLQLYNDKLIIITNKYTNISYDANTWNAIDNSSKTYIAIYNISNINNIKLDKILSYDGYMSDNRMIGSKLYITTNNNINYDRLSKIKLKLNTWNINSWNTIKNDIISQISWYCNTGWYISSGNSANILSLINIDINDYTSNIKNIVWVDGGSFFMSEKYIYLLNPIYLSESNFNCPPNAKCVNPLIYRPNLSFTNIIKLSLSDWWYINNNLTTGSINNPYNLWEYENGLVAVSTIYDNKTYQPTANVSKFDANMNLVKVISNIKQNEDIKSVRFLWDKLYLVTFRQTDPLFVIDLKKLDIIWELKIPGFSTYLHPYSTIGNKQYLIWLGSDVDESTNRINGIKLDLYEIDFGNTKPTIKQKFTKTIAGKWSYSEALTNPRMFVRDSMRNKLLIPIIRQDQVCKKDYSCDYLTLFDGFKSIGIYMDKWIIQHGSYDYQKLNKSNNNYFGYGSTRVGYSSDTIYYINPNFVDFLGKWTLNLDQK